MTVQWSSFEGSKPWRALSDMKVASDAARGTTSEGTTTGQHSASAAITQKNPISLNLTRIRQEEREQMAKIKQLLMEEYIQTFQYQYQELFDKNMESKSLNFYMRKPGGTLTESNSASPTETKTENLSVFKDVTTTPKGQLKPST